MLAAYNGDMTSDDTADEVDSTDVIIAGASVNR